MNYKNCEEYVLDLLLNEEKKNEMLEEKLRKVIRKLEKFEGALRLLLKESTQKEIDLIDGTKDNAIIFQGTTIFQSLNRDEYITYTNVLNGNL